MAEDGIVVFKGRKDAIVVDVDAEAEFGAVVSALKSKVVKARAFLGGADTAVLFKGRDFTDDEQDELLTVFREFSDLNITYSGEDKGVVPKQETAAPPYEGYVNTRCVEGGLRGGIKIEYAGNVVVWGNVNPGAEIIAEGHVIVLGALRGLAHAGCSGDSSKSVTALSMQPTQIIIADKARYFPKEGSRTSRRLPRPTKAFIKDGVICIEELS